MEHRIIIAGSGGQGVLFLGRLLATAAMLEGREVTWFPSYGAEIRGGTANCTVIIADRMIGSPVVRNPDVLVVMNDASHQRFADRVVPGGVLLLDGSHVHATTHRRDIRVIEVPAGGISSSLNCARSANIALLGALIAATGMIRLPSALRALEEITPARRAERLSVNKEILLKGYSSLGIPAGRTQESGSMASSGG